MIKFFLFLHDTFSILSSTLDASREYFLIAFASSSNSCIWNQFKIRWISLSRYLWIYKKFYSYQWQWKKRSYLERVRYWCRSSFSFEYSVLLNRQWRHPIDENAITRGAYEAVNTISELFQAFTGVVFQIIDWMLCLPNWPNRFVVLVLFHLFLYFSLWKK